MSAGGRRPIILPANVSPPPLRAEHLSRPRLVEALRAAAGCRLTVVCAPAGFGKTTLLAEWRGASDRPVAWLSLHDSHNDLRWFWIYVVEAIERAAPGATAETAELVRSPATIRELVLPRLAAALADAPPLAVVLDDYHHVTNPGVHETLAWLVDHLPATTQLVVSGRTVPPLQLAKLRAHGQLAELRTADLRFTDGEAAEFLSGILHAFSADDAQVLAQRTEGWPAGLYLAALSVGDAADPSELARRFEGTNRYVADFLVGDVLEAQPRELQEFMLETSVLERLSAPLCDAVRGRTDSAELLARLEEANLFLVPLDDRREWYRFHQLFAQMLARELERRSPGASRALHERALAWHRSAGDRDATVHHALGAGAYDLAADLISADWLPLVNEGRRETPLAWLARLPDRVVADDPRLLEARAWLLGLGPRRAAAAKAYAAAAEAAVVERDGALPDGFASVRSSITILRAATEWHDNGIRLAEGRRAVELEPPESVRRSLACYGLGLALYYAGRDGEARSWLDEAVSSSRTEQTVVDALARATLARLDALEGDLDAAAHQVETAHSALCERGYADSTDATPVYAARGVVLGAMRRLDEAVASFERCQATRRERPRPLDLVDWLVPAAPVYAAAGERRRARALLAEARELLASCSDCAGLERQLAAAEHAVRASAEVSRKELTEREVTILRLLRDGLTRSEIARELYVSPHTVHTHTKAIYRKLGASSRDEAVVRARRLGYL